MGFLLMNLKNLPFVLTLSLGCSTVLASEYTAKSLNSLGNTRQSEQGSLFASTLGSFRGQTQKLGRLQEMDGPSKSSREIVVLSDLGSSRYPASLPSTPNLSAEEEAKAVDLYRHTTTKQEAYQPTIKLQDRLRNLFNKSEEEEAIENPQGPFWSKYPDVATNVDASKLSINNKNSNEKRKIKAANFRIVDNSPATIKADEKPKLAQPVKAKSDEKPKLDQPVKAKSDEKPKLVNAETVKVEHKPTAKFIDRFRRLFDKPVDDSQQEHPEGPFWGQYPKEPEKVDSNVIVASRKKNAIKNINKKSDVSIADEPANKCKKLLSNSKEQDAKIKSEAELAAKTNLENAAQIKALQIANVKEQAANAKAEQAAKAKAEQEAKLKAEQAAKAKAEQEAKLKAEQAKASQESKLVAREITIMAIPSDKHETINSKDTASDEWKNLRNLQSVDSKKHQELKLAAQQEAKVVIPLRRNEKHKSQNVILEEVLLLDKTPEPVKETNEEPTKTSPKTYKKAPMIYPNKEVKSSASNSKASAAPDASKVPSQRRDKTTDANVSSPIKAYNP